MNKAILVIDMPNSCYGCVFHYEVDDGTHLSAGVCMALGGKDIYTDKRKYDKCPLRPMPEKSLTGKSDYYQWGDWEDGWNACIDSLNGE